MSDRLTGDGGRADVPLVVLAAGRATRYGGVKPLAPVGPFGEAIVDLLASDALGAGFERLVLVVGPETGPAIRYHVERTWPPDLDVRFAVQASPRGTVDAVRTAYNEIGSGTSFGVANADDLPTEAGLSLLARHLSSDDPAHATVCYRLADTLLGTAPVTRGLCDVGEDGALNAISERRQVRALGDGRIEAGDGREPVELDPGLAVSMNLWGFRPAIRPILDAASDTGAEAEVLLPDAVDRLVSGVGVGDANAGAGTVRVLVAAGRCIGVTHAEDVELVQAELARQVGRGDRTAQLWAHRPAARTS